MTKPKYTTKELKRPDRFREILAESLENLSKYFNRILVAIGVLVLALLGFCFASSEVEKEELLANKQFQKALESYGEEEMGKSLEYLSKVREEHPKTDVSTLSLYHMGMINYKIGNFEETIKNLELFLAEDKDIEDGIFKDGSNLVIGLCEFELENWERSIKRLSEVDNPESPYYLQARRYLGLIYEKTGEKEKAERIRQETDYSEKQ